MFTDLRNILSRAEPTLARDALGVAVLMVILLAGLHLPGLV